MASEGGTDDAKRRGDAFACAFSAHLARQLYSHKLYLINLLPWFTCESCISQLEFCRICNKLNGLHPDCNIDLCSFICYNWEGK